jgi:phage recombination protein Bet
MATGANPFLREIYIIKYSDNKPASIFLGYTMYLRIADQSPHYRGYIADAIYSNDRFIVVNGVPEHQYNPCQDRGKLLGAYCIVKQDHREDTYIYVSFVEYNKNQSTWQAMPATMITKVAISQALRRAFPDRLAGTYSDAEQWDAAKEPKKYVAPPPAPPLQTETIDKSGIQERLLAMHGGIEEVNAWLSSVTDGKIQDTSKLTDKQWHWINAKLTKIESGDADGD